MLTRNNTDFTYFTFLQLKSERNLIGELSFQRTIGRAIGTGNFGAGYRDRTGDLYRLATYRSTSELNLLNIVLEVLGYYIVYRR